MPLNVRVSAWIDFGHHFVISKSDNARGGFVHIIVETDGPFADRIDLGFESVVVLEHLATAAELAKQTLESDCEVHVCVVEEPTAGHIVAVPTREAIPAA